MESVKLEQYRTLLHALGFRATPVRLCIIELFHKAKKPLSIAEIQDDLKNDADLATIYRIVNALGVAGLIKQVDFQHGHAHYELATREHHHHLICQKCGKVVDISKCDTSGLEKQALKIGGFAKINSHSLEFFGVCSSCKNK
jgi:Fur family ferric uptake transcriptional regulator